jgi:hypothetical protein
VDSPDSGENWDYQTRLRGDWIHCNWPETRTGRLDSLSLTWNLTWQTGLPDLDKLDSLTLAWNWDLENWIGLPGSGLKSGLETLPLPWPETRPGRLDSPVLTDLSPWLWFEIGTSNTGLLWLWPKTGTAVWTLSDDYRLPVFDLKTETFRLYVLTLTWNWKRKGVNWEKSMLGPSYSHFNCPSCIHSP